MASCLTPYNVKLKMKSQTAQVPCGKCPECVKRRVSGWSFRLMQENKISRTAYFVTLTYDTKHVPITRNAGYMTLNKKDLQDFFKRLRKAHEVQGKTVQNIKYYAVGEYGGKTTRPHYHIILFNSDLAKISPAWNMGNVHYDPVNEATVGYTLKYISKPPSKQIPLHRNDDRQPQFAIMSKGLGENYIENNANVHWHHADLDNRMYLNIEDGKKIAMPRYYKNKIYNDLERKRVSYFTQFSVKQKINSALALDENYFVKRLGHDLGAFAKLNYKSSNRDKL